MYFMENLIRSFFEKEKIEYYACAKIDEKYVRIARKLPPFAKYVTVFLVPYKAYSGKRNVSYYAVPRDYHFYIKQLETRLKKELEENGILENVALFADNSPFDERKLAVDMHLGFVGENRLLINEKYGSYVFLAEIVTESPLSLFGENKASASSCLSCGRCKKECPAKSLDGNSSCMSEITQKKLLSDDEKQLLKSHPLVWGCDICQQVCPHNTAAAQSPIKFFSEDLLPMITKEDIENMDDTTFSERAYAWRGKNVILRNLTLSDIL